MGLLSKIRNMPRKRKLIIAALASAIGIGIGGYNHYQNTRQVVAHAPVLSPASSYQSGVEYTRNGVDGSQMIKIFDSADYSLSGITRSNFPSAIYVDENGDGLVDIITKEKVLETNNQLHISITSPQNIGISKNKTITMDPNSKENRLQRKTDYKEHKEEFDNADRQMEKMSKIK